jgi:hypothetical protein
MRKQHDSDHVHLPKLTLAILALALLILPTIANAEICDKAVGDAWRREHGPVWLLNPVGFPFGLIFLAGTLILLAVVRIQWFQWLGYFVAALLLLGTFLLIVADLIPQHDIYMAQIREGCRSYRTDLMNVAVSVPLAAFYAWLGYRVRHRAAVVPLAGA